MGVVLKNNKEPYYVDDISLHPKKCLCINDFYEENRFFDTVLSDCTRRGRFTEMSNKDGTEVLTELGYFCIWYYNSHKKKIVYDKICIYNEVTSVYYPEQLEKIIKYISRYYNVTARNVIEILFIQYNDFVWTYNPKIDKISKVNINNLYYKVGNNTRWD